MAKKLTLNQAAKKLSDIIWSHIKHLPPAERRRRTENAHKRLMERMKERLKWN